MAVREGYEQGILPDDLSKEITRLDLWLESHSSTWSLAENENIFGVYD